MLNIKVRFAPSPTGFLHVGGLRTAFYNYLFAKANSNGKLVLRIEDTDQKRTTPEAVKNLLNTLKWAGIYFDEGPETDGAYGPYWQSKRLDIYHHHSKILLDNHDAYYCFCSSETLTKMREEQIKKKQSPRYDGRCRRLSFAEVDKKIADKEPYVIRMKIKLTKQKFIFDDIIRSKVIINARQIDDQVIIKSDGYPTYHLANVVDDHLMQVNYVIRGEEWLSSTPKHLLLYEYFKWKPPVFAHLPLLLNTDRSKLSKRQGSVAVEDFIKQGYLKEGLLNFITLLGWSNKDDREIFTPDELLEKFNLDGINKAGAIFDVQKLDWINQQHIQLINVAELDKRAIDGGFYPPNLAALPVDKRFKILEIIKAGLVRMDKIAESTKVFFAGGPPDKEMLSYLNNESTKKLLFAFKTLLVKFKNNPAVKFDKQAFKDITKKTGEITNLKGPELFKPLRITLTNATLGPDLPALAEYYGIDEIDRKIDQTLKLLT